MTVFPSSAKLSGERGSSSKNFCIRRMDNIVSPRLQRLSPILRLVHACSATKYAKNVKTAKNVSSLSVRRNAIINTIAVIEALVAAKARLPAKYAPILLIVLISRLKAKQN